MEGNASSARSDLELIRTVREAGEPAASRAARELFGRYHHRVYGWCRRYSRDPEWALDLTQEVLAVAFRSLHTYQGRAPFGGWLFTITRHACLRAVRKRRLDMEEEAILETIPDPRPDPETMLEDEEARVRLLALIETALEPHERSAIWLRCVERLPVDEITRLLELDSASGARGVLQNARRKLRLALEKDRQALREREGGTRR